MSSRLQGAGDCRRCLGPLRRAAPAARLDVVTQPSSPLKQRLRDDLNMAIKQRDRLRSSTIRMVLTAISQAEVAGSTAVTLTDQQVLQVVVREASKRREAEEAYAAADRPELAEKEHAEAEVLADYLPAPMTAAELEALVSETIA